MDKRLKLLITERYPIYYNSKIKPTELPVVGRWDYKDIILTGDEFIMFSKVKKLINLIKSIKTISNVENGNFSKIYIDTSYCLCDIVDILKTKYIDLRADGIIITLNDTEKINHLVYTNEFILYYRNLYKNTSFVLNVDPKIIPLIEKIDLSLWKINLIGSQTIDNSEFKRIANLWK